MLFFINKSHSIVRVHQVGQLGIVICDLMIEEPGEFIFNMTKNYSIKGLVSECEEFDTLNNLDFTILFDT